MFFVWTLWCLVLLATTPPSSAPTYFSITSSQSMPFPAQLCKHCTYSPRNRSEDTKMYANKRRQRNFKRVRTTPDQPKAPAGTALFLAPASIVDTQFCGQVPPHQPALLPSNPSKRHRERLNGELETVASLLPYDEPVLQRLDKLSVLRLAVSFLQIKAHFQVCAQQAALGSGRCGEHPFAQLRVPLGAVPSLVDPQSALPSIDFAEPHFSQLAQKSLGAFLLVLHFDGDIFYVSENIETYLGFQQSEVLHQPLFEMIHSEDREELRTLLQAAQQFVVENVGQSQMLTEWSVPIVLRFRCMLENTCGFVRVELRTRILPVHSHRVDLSPFVPQPSAGELRNQQSDRRHTLAAICTPFVPPLQMDPLLDDPILKSKHALDMGIQCMDSRLRRILEMDDNQHSPCTSSSSASTSSSLFYAFVHPGDVKFVAEAHDSAIKYCSSGLMVYRLVSMHSQLVYFFQSSFRLFFKNGKPDSIGGNHRVLTEIDGECLLEKRNTLKFKYLSFDDTLLQSPRIFQPSSTHSPVPAAAKCAGNEPLSDQKSAKGQATKGGSTKAGKKAAKREENKGTGEEVTATIGLLEEATAAKGQHNGSPFAHLANNNACENGTMGLAKSGNGNSAAALFAAAQLQTNLAIGLGPSSSSSVLPDPIGAIAQWTPAANSGALVSAQSASMAASSGLPATRLKRTQVTFERYYAEMVDLSPYCYYYPPTGSSSTAVQGNLPVDFGYPQQQQHMANNSSAATDYWNSMMAAAVGDPSIGGMYAAGRQQHQTPSSSFTVAFPSHHVPVPTALTDHPVPFASSSPSWLTGGGTLSLSAAAQQFYWPTGVVDFPAVSAASALYPTANHQLALPLPTSTAASELQQQQQQRVSVEGEEGVWTDKEQLQGAEERRPTGKPPMGVAQQQMGERVPPPLALPVGQPCVQTTPGSTSGPSPATGFRFLSEVAQTLFG